MQRFVLILSCQDTKGIVSAVSTFLFQKGGFIIESAQFGDASTGTFFMRTLFEMSSSAMDETAWKAEFSEIAQSFHMNWQLHNILRKQRVLIMVSRQRHCLNDLLHRYTTQDLPMELIGIVSNHTDLEEMANWYKIPFYYMPVTPETKMEQEVALYELVKTQHIDLVILARYMQILSSSLSAKLFGKAINIHHSFLPSFKGARPYHQAFERGVKCIGATAHYITNDLDEGPIIEQEVVKVNHTYTPKDFIKLGQDIESLVLSRAVRYHLEHRIILNGNKTVVFI